MEWDPQALPNLAGRTYVVTGATAGIGYFASEQLAQAGANVVIASRSASKLALAATSIKTRVPEATTTPVIMDLTSLRSIAEAGAQLSLLPRVDGIFLNGGPMQFSAHATTEDGLPLMLGAHTVANVALIAHLMPSLIAKTGLGGPPVRVVHASTGFVRRFGIDVSDTDRTPRTGVMAYTKAKTLTEIFAFELERRLRSSGVPVWSLVARPGIGVDAKTPERAGISDSKVRRRRNPFTPWAQGKDTAAWSGVRALVDPDARGGDYFAPADGSRGEPVSVTPWPRTAKPEGDLAASVWQRLEELGGVTVLDRTP